jgi:hypothetical protein
VLPFSTLITENRFFSNFEWWDDDYFMCSRFPSNFPVYLVATRSGTGQFLVPMSLLWLQMMFRTEKGTSILEHQVFCHSVLPIGLCEGTLLEWNIRLVTRFGFPAAEALSRYGKVCIVTWIKLMLEGFSTAILPFWGFRKVGNKFVHIFLFCCGSRVFCHYFLIQQIRWRFQNRGCRRSLIR